MSQLRAGLGRVTHPADKRRVIRGGIANTERLGKEDPRSK